MQYGFVITNAYGCIQLAAELRAPDRAFFGTLGLARVRMSLVVLIWVGPFGFEFEILFGWAGGVWLPGALGLEALERSESMRVPV